MFQGIDPDGLNGLATTVEHKTASLRHQSRGVSAILSRNQRSPAVAEISAVVGRAEDWGNDTAATLRWRAETIRGGQGALFDVHALAQAAFAAHAVFSATTIDDSYRAWVADWQASNQRVDQAEAQISEWLDQSWTDWDVTNDDLHNIWSIMDRLQGDELSRVIAKLTPHQLERWVDEMGHSINGFTREEKQQVFTMLAENTTGESLGKVHEAILDAADSDQDAIDFGMAIRHHSPDDAIVAFVTFVVTRDLTGHRYSGVAPALTMEGIEDPTAIDQALRAIVTTDGALDVIVIDSLVSARIEDTGTACIEIAPLASLATAMSRGADVELKALGFTTVVGLAERSVSDIAYRLQDRHGRDVSQSGSDRDSRIATAAQRDLISAATRLVISDPDGVIQELATSVDIDGSITSSYLYQLIDHDQFHNLSRTIDALRGGDDVDIERFAQVGTDPGYPYAHAQNLAFVAGALNSALERYAEAARSDIGAIVLVGGVASAIAGTIYALEFKSAQIAAGIFDFSVGEFGVGAVASSTINDINDQLVNVTSTVLRRMQPQGPLEIEPAGLGSALMLWDERYALVHP